jgi:hypothetical protein
MDLEQTDDTPPAILLSNHMVRSEIWIRYTMVSVADPDPGSGIRCLFNPWIRDPGWVKSQDRNPGSGMYNRIIFPGA